jgi:ribonuclease Z
MAKLHLLGTGAALSDPSRTTTMLAFSSGESVVAVDCGGDLIHHILKAGLDPNAIDVLILTHEHPDHVSGFPLFMEKIWLAKRDRPIAVRGPQSALDQARRIFEAFDTSGWKGLPRILWRPVELSPRAAVWENGTWTVTASPGKHSVPTIGIRVEERESGSVAAYSSDTERSDEIARLADAVEILVHEATGGFSGHSSVQEAAHVARQAGAGKLVLVHLPERVDPDDLEEAREAFPALELGEDGATLEF